MVKLNDLQLASLLEEIGAAMDADVPIADAMNRLGSRRLGRVANAGRELGRQLALGKNASVAIESTQSPALKQAAAVIVACEKSNDTSLIRSLATQLRSRHQYSRMARLSWLYPIFLMAIGYLITAAVMAPLVRFNHGQHFAWDNWVYQIAAWLAEFWWLPPIFLVIATIVLMLFLSKKRKMPLHASKQLFFHCLADQVENDVPESEALRTAATMSAQEEILVETKPTFQSAAVKKIMSETYDPLEGVVTVNEQATLVARLRYASALHREEARKNEYFWARLAPRTAMIVFGGGFTLAYAWWIIRPIYQQVAQW